MSSAIADHAFLRNCRGAALFDRSGCIDWLCLPRFDSPACFASLLGTQEHGHWALQTCEPPTRLRQRYREESLVVQSEMEVADGRVQVSDCMPVNPDCAEVIRAVEGLSGCVRMRMRFAPRFGYGSQSPRVSRRGPVWILQADAADESHGSVEFPCSAIAFDASVPCEADGDAIVAEFEIQAGQRATFAMTFAQDGSPPDPPRGCGAGARRLRGVVARLVGPLRVQRPVARTGGSVAGDPERTDLPPDRRDGRRGDDFAAGGARRRAQLGLPLLLVARRHLHAVLAARQWRSRGGGPMARLARGRGQSRTMDDARHVPRRWQPRSAGARTAVAAWALRCAARAHRQWRQCAVPDRHPRRGHGCPARRPPERAGHRRRCLGAATGPARRSGTALARARPWHLGDARRHGAFRPLQGAGLGGFRSRRAAGRARPHGPHGRSGRSLACDPRRDPRGRLPTRVRSRARRVRAALRRTRSGRELRRTGLDFQFTDAGCCGMAGSFGFAADRYDTSIRTAEYALRPKIRAASADTLLLANGFSCREQIRQCTGRQPLDLAEVLRMSLHGAAPGQRSASGPQATTSHGATP